MEQVDRIPSLVRKSLSELEELSLGLAEDSNFASESATSRSHLLKLKLWSGCLGAHRVTGTRSLTYRLRDASSIRKTVLLLLENLERYVKEARAIAQMNSTENDDEELAGDSTDEELAEYFCSNDISGSSAEDDLKRILLQIEEILDCLMRLAITIRNPAPYDQFRSRTGAISLPSQWDIDHVQHKFPNIHPTIGDRLGKALTQRRQYLRYREEHHLRLQEGLDKNDDNNNGSKGKGTTIASYVPHDSICHVPTPLEENEDAYSENSTISYATTSADQGAPRIPPIPLGYESGPFLCPFCHMIISIDDESDWKARLAWKKHVYRDLRPYVCVEVQCTMASQDFQKRKDWIRHMLQEHWKVWTCPFDCTTGFLNSNDSRNHTLEKHRAQVTAERVDDLVSLSSNADPTRAEGKCPLCLTFDIKSSRMYESHLGKHLEQLSLFVLPRTSDDKGEQDDDTTDNGEADQEDEHIGHVGSEAGSEEGSEELPESSLASENDSQDSPAGDRSQSDEHQDETHRVAVRRFSWSCSALATYDRAFYGSTTRPSEADTCGYCGEEFPRSGPRSGLSTASHVRHVTEQDWDERVRHLQDHHKYRECNTYKKFFRADHFRQHLKYSHAATIGTGNNVLVNECRMEEAVESEDTSRSPKKLGASIVTLAQSQRVQVRTISGTGAAKSSKQVR